MNGIANHLPAENALMHDFAYKISKFSGVIPRPPQRKEATPSQAPTLALSMTRTPCAGVQAPPVLGPRHQVPLGPSVPIVPVLRNDHCFKE